MKKERVSDERIIEDIKQGNVGAYEEIVRRYQRPFFVFIHHMIEDTGSCEDLVQETFIKIYKSIDRIDTSRKFSTYAFEIAKNTAFSYLRAFKKTVSLTKVDVENDENLYEKMAHEYDRREIRKAIWSLKKSYKDVVSLYYFEDLSYEEIAKKLELPINTVRTHLRRGRQSLKRILEEK